jgi:hypothetical protein
MRVPMVASAFSTFSRRRRVKRRKLRRRPKLDPGSLKAASRFSPEELSRLAETRRALFLKPERLDQDMVPTYNAPELIRYVESLDIPVKKPSDPWYVPDITRKMDPHFESEEELSKRLKRERLRRTGRGPPKKGSGRRQTVRGGGKNK